MTGPVPLLHLHAEGQDPDAARLAALIIVPALLFAADEDRFAVFVRETRATAEDADPEWLAILSQLTPGNLLEVCEQLLSGLEASMDGDAP